MTVWADVVPEIEGMKTATAGLASTLDHVEQVMQELRDKHPDGPTQAEMDAAIADLRSSRGAVIEAVKRGTAVSVEPPFEPSNQ